MAGTVLTGFVVVSVWQDQPSAQPAPLLPVLPVAPPAVPPPAPEKVVVSVVGLVHRPGLVTVDAGDRVADALTAAGGALPGTDITALNLARKVADGEQLYVAVPVPAQAGGEQPAAPGEDPAAGGGKVNLNTASTAELDELPGVGPVTAERIVQWRTEHGRFASVDQLREVGGIGETRMSRLQDLVRV